jgi:hypothetical protein
VLKSGDEIVGVAEHEHVPLRDFLSPYIYSEVEHKQAEGDFPLPNKLRRRRGIIEDAAFVEGRTLPTGCR